MWSSAELLWWAIRLCWFPWGIAVPTSELLALESPSGTTSFYSLLSQTLTFKTFQKVGSKLLRPGGPHAGLLRETEDTLDLPRLSVNQRKSFKSVGSLGVQKTYFFDLVWLPLCHSTGLASCFLFRLLAACQVTLMAGTRPQTQTWICCKSWWFLVLLLLFFLLLQSSSPFSSSWLVALHLIV